MLSNVIQQSSNRRTSNNFINEKVLPEFDPAQKSLSASDWLNKVNTHGILYEWNDKTKLYLAVCRLRGNAKLWYDELHDSHLSWSVFSHAIVKQFPGDVSFGQLLEEAATYKSTPGEDLQYCCFKKLGKLNKLKLDIAEEKLVDFVVHGIHDDSIRTAISVARCKNLHELYTCFNSFHIANTKQKDIRKPRQNDGTSGKAGGRDGKSSNTCHMYRQPGHYKRNCPKNRNSADELGPSKTTRELNKNDKMFSVCTMVGS